MATPRKPVAVIVDANVLSKPATRSLLWMSASQSGTLELRWSAHAETEGDRNLRGSQTKVEVLRTRLGMELSPTGIDPERFIDSDPKDRQILADALAAHARYLVTENVRHFAVADLDALGIAAVHPDLFMSIRFSRETYRAVLDQLAAGRTKRPRTPAEIHAAVAGHLPRLYAAHADLYDSVPDARQDDPPKLSYRGSICIRCARPFEVDAGETEGLGPRCRNL